MSSNSYHDEFPSGDNTAHFSTSSDDQAIACAGDPCDFEAQYSMVSLLYSFISLEIFTDSFIVRG